MRSTAFVTLAIVIGASLLGHAETQGTPEITKHLGELRAAYDLFVDAHVMKPFETDVAILDAKYSKAIGSAGESAANKGAAEVVAAVRAEQTRIVNGGDLPENDAALPVSFRPLRATYRTELAKLVQERDVNMRDALKRYDTALGQYQAQLAQTQDLDTAMSVRTLREDLAARGAVVPQKGAVINSLGMKFVPVKGTKVLFCVHHTRHADYAVYAAEVPGVAPIWKSQNFHGFAITSHADDCPVVTVSWDDARAFCAWLSKKEHKNYRLPTDREWSIAVGTDAEEKWTEGVTPETVFKSQTGFPWGNQWPPPEGAGNYSDQSRKRKAPREEARYITNYDDGYPILSPVMSFKPNKFGLYDMGGNAWQWCEDFWNADEKEHVMRGGSWDRYERSLLLSSARLHHLPDLRSGNFGFRIVLVPGAAP